MLNIGHSHEDKQTQDTIKAYAFEHFEIGAYTSLKAYADAIGDHETAQLAQTIIGEEQLAAERLQRLIPQIGGRGPQERGRSDGLTGALAKIVKTW